MATENSTFVATENCTIWTPPGCQVRFEVLDIRLQFYIRPLRAGSLPAGPDGIRRPASLSLQGLFAQSVFQTWRIAVLPVGHHLVSSLAQPLSCVLPGSNVAVEPTRLRQAGAHNLADTCDHEPARPKSCAPACSPAPLPRQWSAAFQPPGYARLRSRPSDHDTSLMGQVTFKLRRFRFPGESRWDQIGALSSISTRYTCSPENTPYTVSIYARS